MSSQKKQSKKKKSTAWPLGGKRNESHHSSLALERKLWQINVYQEMRGGQKPQTVNTLKNRWSDLLCLPETSSCIHNSLQTEGTHRAHAWRSAQVWFNCTCEKMMEPFCHTSRQFWSSPERNSVRTGSCTWLAETQHPDNSIFQWKWKNMPSSWWVQPPLYTTTPNNVKSNTWKSINSRQNF